MNPKSEFFSLIKNCKISSSDTDLKMVKNSMLFVNDGIIYIKHYNTIIFAYDPKTQRCEIDKNCSMTSNRQIYRTLDHFGIVEASCINVHEGSKMNCSGDRY